MSDEITVSFPATILEALRCFICKGYLSCSPILLLPSGGNYICGRCAPLNMDTPTHRLIPLETVLSSMPFPCVFKEHGCREILSFGKTVDHELQCIHKLLACPTKTFTTCPWEGTVIHLFQHFEEDHPDAVKETIEFRLELTKDARGFLITSIPFIVNYFYNSEERLLQYDGRYCGNQREHGMSWKLQLISSNDRECSFNLKMNTCLSYDESFGGVQNGKLLDINKFIEILGDPDSIIIAVNVKIPELNCNRAMVGLIDKLKCNKCCNYLVPPLFDLDGKVMCADCSEDNPTCTPSDDPNLLKLVNEAMYPCCWRGCNFVSNSHVFKKHMMDCEFRLYHCIYSSCKVTFLLGAAADHLKTHESNSTIYMPNKITYQTSFERDYDRKHINSIINNKLICFEHKMMSKGSQRLHEINIYRAPDNSHGISCSATFEHVHCKLTKSIAMPKTDLCVKVAFKEFPPCFQETDELTVHIEVVV